MSERIRSCRELKAMGYSPLKREQYFLATHPLVSADDVDTAREGYCKCPNAVPDAEIDEILEHQYGAPADADFNVERACHYCIYLVSEAIAALESGT